MNTVLSPNKLVPVALAVSLGLMLASCSGVTPPVVPATSNAPATESAQLSSQAVISEYWTARYTDSANPTVAATFALNLWDNGLVNGGRWSKSGSTYTVTYPTCSGGVWTATLINNMLYGTWSDPGCGSSGTWQAWRTRSYTSAADTTCRNRVNAFLGAINNMYAGVGYALRINAVQNTVGGCTL